MKLAVVGTGYVGLVTGTCFADSGNEVICVDNDPEKLRVLEEGGIPIYEPGLKELVDWNRAQLRLSFTDDLAAAVQRSDVIFIAVGTPQAADGSPDLSSLWSVVDGIADAMSEPRIIVIKSTVPVGTTAAVERRLAERAKCSFEVASNPEFLKEGAAIDDFVRPDRVVLGVRKPEVAEVLRQLYAPFLRTDRPFLVMSPESSEMTKYVANAMLATKISFINEMANLCERVGADVNEVRRGIGHDQRIGFAFLFPGVGYGGSCLPKDVRALSAVARSAGIEPHILDAVDRVNEAQKRVLWEKIKRHFGDGLAGRTLAIWGLSFKPRTDDLREAPSLMLINLLLDAGAKLRVHDPVAIPNARRRYGELLIYCDLPYGALEQADALAIVTEWNEFRNPDFELMRRLMRQPVVFDGRNLYEPEQMARHGFWYYSIGRRTIKPVEP